ncbi:MAG: hypothetical protein NZM02_02695 [Patescibacteria group bacterium]|nr:hypothetical protein [Patescibacteria group bacterium]
MRRYSLAETISLMREKQISLFSLADFGRLFEIENKETLYKKISRLEKKKIIRKLIKGKYLFLFNQPDDYLIANYLYQPSYISLETALSFYGLITGFSYKITSITPKKTKNIIVDNKEFSYTQISLSLFWGYEKKQGFLLAEKEKALLDYLYLYTKGLRGFDKEEFELKEINKKKLFSYAKKFNNPKLLSIIDNL